MTRAERAPREDAQDNKLGGKYLNFYLADEEFGIEILKVQEIIGLMPVTHVPRVPKFIKGVINLRGKVIPVIDLRLKLSMGEVEQTEETCIIVVRTQDMEMGAEVDKVSEVLTIADDDIEDVPSFGHGINTDYILGVGRAGGKVKLLLNIDKVLSTQDILEFKKLRNHDISDSEGSAEEGGDRESDESADIEGGESKEDENVQ